MDDLKHIDYMMEDALFWEDVFLTHNRILMDEKDITRENLMDTWCECHSYFRGFLPEGEHDTAERVIDIILEAYNGKSKGKFAERKITEMYVAKSGAVRRSIAKSHIKMKQDMKELQASFDGLNSLLKGWIEDDKK